MRKKRVTKILLFNLNIYFLINTVKPVVAESGGDGNLPYTGNCKIF